MSEQEEEKKKFDGIEEPRANFFMLPHQWIDICAEIDNLAELKVVQYVLRHTWGFQEYDDTPKHITLDEFMHGRRKRDGTRIDKGTGLSRQGVKDGITRAIDDGLLICEVDDRDKARIQKSYAINRKQVQKKPQEAQPSGLQRCPLNSTMEGYVVALGGKNLALRDYNVALGGKNLALVQRKKL